MRGIRTHDLTRIILKSYPLYGIVYTTKSWFCESIEFFIFYHERLRFSAQRSKKLVILKKISIRNMAK